MAVDMLIKQMPDELKSWIAEQARRHHRSMNKEALAVLESARAARTGAAGPTAAGKGEIATLLERFRALPELDRRTVDEILGYDADGLPQ